jgi:hypothetical protein
MIYLYWEGDNRHWYYDLCLETVKRHNPSAVVLGPQDIADIVGPTPQAIQNAYIAHRVDWIRKVALYALGGMWLDMDFICFQPLEEIATLHSCFDYVGYKEWGGTWMDNLFVARKASPILRAAAEYASSQLTAHGGSVNWVATSSWAQKHAIEQVYPWGYWMQIPTHLVEPVDVNAPEWFFEPPHGDEIERTNSFGFMTSFHALRRLLPHSREELVASNTRLARILHRALKF